MPELDFTVVAARPLPFAATPELALELRVTASPADAEVHAVLLRCQVRIVASQRGYGQAEQSRLRDLFGDGASASRGNRNLVWTEISTSLRSFTGEALVELALPCSVDLDSAIGKYFSAVEGGALPLSLLFSGTMFHASPAGTLSVTPIAWSKEAKFLLPSELIRQVLALHHPHRAPVLLDRTLLERLDAYRSERGLTSIEHALGCLLDEAELGPSRERTRG